MAAMGASIDMAIRPIMPRPPPPSSSFDPPPKKAVQHHCVNMLTYSDTMGFMTDRAAWRISVGLSFGKEAAMCKAWVSDSFVSWWPLATR